MVYGQNVVSSNLSIFTQGISIYELRDIAINKCFYGIANELSRRRRSFLYVMTENFVFVTSMFLVAKWMQ